MSYQVKASCVLTLGALLISVIGCSGGKAPRVKQAAFDSAAGSKAIEMYDANKDGKISGAEFDKCPAIKIAISRMDPKGQSEATAETIDAQVKKWTGSKTSRTSFFCKVCRNGVPLADATVTFVPEKFLGPNVRAAVGKTDKTGVTPLNIGEGRSAVNRGIGPGFYRVVITKDGMTIPDKYSTEAGTVFGEVIAPDTPALSTPTYDLKF